MAVRNVTLFANGPYPVGDPLAPGRLISGPTSAQPPILPPINAGDTWNVKLYYYLGDGSAGSPFFNYRFAGSSTAVRIKARGNNTVYATAVSVSEIGSESNSQAFVTRLDAGDATHIARHAVAFDAAAGTFQLTIPAPNIAALDSWSHNSNPNDSVFYASGTTAPIAAGASAAEIEAALNALAWRSAIYSNGRLVTFGGTGTVSSAGAARFHVTDAVPFKGFTIEYGALVSGHNPQPFFLAAAEFDGSGLTTIWGWNVTLVLDGNGHTFNDYFLSANKPAYLEVLLTRPGSAEEMAAEMLLPSESEVPVITNGPPGGGRVDQVYAFRYSATHAPSFSLTAGTLPNGLGLSADGTISGTPIVAGTFSGSVTATNAYGSVTQNFSIVVLPVLPAGTLPPVITNGPPGGGQVGSPYNFAYAAAGNPEFSLVAGALPSGLTLSAGGVIAGTPTVTGTFTGTVAAANTAGSATQNFSIIIAVSGGGGPPTTLGLLLTKRDGDFSSLVPCDGVWYETFDEWPGLILWHIPCCVDQGQAGAPAIGGYEAPFGYFLRDTPWKYVGDNLVMFERLRHNIPGDANRPVSVSKNYQAGQYNFANGGIASQAITSFSRDIKANCNFHYALDDAGGLPILPFIQIVPFLTGQVMTDVGTGFPFVTFNPPTGGSFSLPNNNFASSFIAGSHDHVFGRLFCRKTITG